MKIHVKKRNVKIASPASSGGHSNYVECVGFPWPPLEVELAIFNITPFSLKQQTFTEGINKDRVIFINDES